MVFWSRVNGGIDVVDVESLELECMQDVHEKSLADLIE